MVVETMMIGKIETIIVTSLDVAKTFGKEHNKVLRDVRELECSEGFRLSNFGQSSYVNSQNKKMPMYYMTKDGFTLLVMGYNGEKAMEFKEGYIRQFNEMEKLLTGKIRERDKGIVVRQAFTKAIQQSSENERMHGHAYSTYTDVIYKSIFGKNAKQLREEFGISKKESMRDYFSEEDLVKIQNAEMLVSALVGYGWGYNEIKEFILNKGINKIAA